MSGIDIIKTIKKTNNKKHSLFSISKIKINKHPTAYIQLYSCLSMSTSNLATRRSYFHNCSRNMLREKGLQPPMKFDCR